LALSAGTASAPALTTTGDTNTGIFFPAADTIAFAEGGVESARFDSSGNLGIGTSSPGARTEIFNSSGSNILRLSRSATDRLDFYAGSGVSYIDSSPAGGQLAFATVGTERARIDSSGKFLVGTTSGGTDKVRIASAGVTENQLGLVSTDNASNNGFIQFRDSGGTSIGSIARNGSSNAVLYNTTSDYRLKEQVTPMSEGLAKVMALKPVKWVWKDCNGAIGEGFIAHEVQEVVPSAVSGEKDAVSEDGSIKPQGMDASYLVATLTAAIQEQQALIQTLTARVEALEGK
jgi:hypothetical protein